MFFFLILGAIFYDNYEAEIAFKYSTERVNMHEENFELIPIVRHVSGIDSFKTEKIGKICSSKFN